MPPLDESPERSLQDVVDAVGSYPVEAFDFIQRGLSFTVERLHDEREQDPQACRHVSGPQLCEGLRDFALTQWGMLAQTVLKRWNITSTYDFGRIVFALVENGFMQKTDEDNIEDFRNVYDFKSAFGAEYRIGARP